MVDGPPASAPREAAEHEGGIGDATQVWVPGKGPSRVRGRGRGRGRWASSGEQQSRGTGEEGREGYRKGKMLLGRG